MHPTVDKFSKDISRSMLNQHLKFDFLAENGLLKRINDSNRDNEAHKSQEMKINGLDFFINISQFMMIQRLKFGHIPVFGLPNMFNRLELDHDLGATKIKKMKGVIAIMLL